MRCTFSRKIDATPAHASKSRVGFLPQIIPHASFIGPIVAERDPSYHSKVAMPPGCRVSSRAMTCAWRIADDLFPSVIGKKEGIPDVTPRQPTDPATDHEPQPHPNLSWFLRRELVTIPLFVVIVGTLLVFGISPATLLFVILLTIVVLGFVWGGAPGRSE